jgi:hypothetical protein
MWTRTHHTEVKSKDHAGVTAQSRKLQTKAIRNSTDLVPGYAQFFFFLE